MEQIRPKYTSLFGFLIFLPGFVSILFFGSIIISFSQYGDPDIPLEGHVLGYFMSLIFGITLFGVIKGLRKKIYFIHFLGRKTLRVTNIFMISQEEVNSSEIRGYSKHKNHGGREFYRIYFQDRADITFLDCYKNFDQLEDEFQRRNIELLGLEDFESDIWGAPKNQQF